MIKLGLKSGLWIFITTCFICLLSFEASAKETAPQIDLTNWLTSPNGGESFAIGSTIPIQINAAVYTPPGNPAIVIELYQGATKVWGPSYSGMTNRAISTTGLTVGTNYRVKIYVATNPTQEDWSNSYFSLTPALPPNLSNWLTSPNGGEYFTIGSTISIQLNASIHTPAGNPTIVIELYKGSVLVAPSFGGMTDRTFSASGLVAGTDYKFRVYNASNPVEEDWSNAFFSIGGSAPNLTSWLTTPNGGQNIVVGNAIPVTANGSILTPATLAIELYKGSTRVLGPLHSGMSNRTIPTTGLAPGTDYKVRIYNASNFSEEDWSDSYFSITTGASFPDLTNWIISPNGGESYAIGSTLLIQINASLYSPPGNPAIVLELYKGTSKVWGPSYSGMTNRTISTSGLDASTDYKVRIYNSSNPVEEDWGNGYFSLVSGGPIGGPCPAPTVHSATGCSSGAPVQLSASNTESSSFSICGKAVTHKWYTSATGSSIVTPTVGSTGTCAFYNTFLSVTSPTSYWVSAMIDGCESARTLVTASYQTLPPATGLGASICGSGSMILTATPGIAGKSIHWYNNQFNGSHSFETPFAEGISYTTPSLDDSRTYYVSTYDPNTGCDSPTPRTPVTATVNPIPAVPRGDDNFTCGPGTVVLQGTPGLNGNMVRWYPNQTGPTTIPDGFSYKPYIGYPTKFYISSLNTNTGCESSRVSVEGTIKSPPPAPTGYDVIACHTGAQTSVQAQNIESANYSICNKPLTHKWYSAETNGAVVPHTIHSTGTCAVYSTGVSITSAVSYSVVSVVDGCESARTKVTAVYDDGGDVPVLTVTPTLVYEQSKYFGAVFCALNGTANPTLTASGGTNASEFAWYEVLEYGPAIRQGSSFIPSINMNETTNGIKTYYVGGILRNGLGCPFPITPRRPVSVKLLEYQNNANAGPDKEFFTNYEPMAFTTNDEANFWRGNGTSYSPVNGSQAQKGYFYPSLAGTGTHTISHTYKFSYDDTFQKCETQPDEAIYTVYQAPTIEFLGNQIISKGNNVTLAAAGDTYISYQWYGPNGIIDGAGGNTFETTMPGVYSLEVKKGQIFTTVNRRVKSLLDDENCIVTYTPQKSGYENDLTFSHTSVENVSEVVNYFDEIGRPMQNVITQGSPGNLDIVQPIVYDEQGRKKLKYLPFTAENNGKYKPTREIIDENNQNYIGIAESFYKPASANMIADDLKPYNKTIFEPSPLNRIIKQGAPGEAWQPKPDPTDFTDNSIKKQYVTNTPNEVLRWTYIPSTHLVSAKNGSTIVYYAPNELFVTKTYDEHNKQIIEYTDKEGKTVLKRVQATATPGSLTDSNKDINYASTYYIYDDFGSLVTVIQPEGVSKLTSLYPNSPNGVSAPLPETFLVRWAFRYKYDSRKRMTEKWVPGANGPVRMVYDNRDRIVLTQDANQRSVGTKYWTFTKYDELNRPILTGIKDTTAEMTQVDMQAHVDAHYQKSWVKWGESYVGNAASNIHGYSNNSYPTTTSNSAANPLDFLTVTYYDNYTFRDNWDGSYSYVDENLTETLANTLYEQPDNEFPNVKGLVTGTKVKVLDGGVRGGQTWLHSINYYDDRYRPVQNLSENTAGGIDRSTSVFDFQGKVIKTKITHKRFWRDVVGVTTTPNSLHKVLASSSWSAGAASVAELKPGEDGWMQVTVSEINSFTMIGLSDANPNVDQASIDYAFYLFGNRLFVRENGIEKKNVPGVIALNDILKIIRTGTTVRYYKNAIEVYVSNAPSTGKLMVDASLYHNASTLMNIQTSFGGSFSTIVRRFEYDHAGRLTNIWHQLNAAPEILLSKNEYNELGQLVDKKLHSNNGNATDAKQSVDYRYNIRGWLTSINDASVTPDAQSNEARDLFGMELGYNETLGLSGPADLQYNGNISAIKWNAMPGTASVEAPQKGYAFSYDPMNRLQKAEYKEKATTWNSSAAFNEDNLQYDLNGNIQKLNRKQNGEQIDQLDYAYGTGTGQSNRLLSVTDAADDEKGFRELNSPGADYEYDDNGNLIWDRNRGGAEFLSNGSFDNGSSGWTITGASQRFTFGSGQLEVNSNTSTAEIYVSSGIIPAKPYVVVIDFERTSTTGTIVMKVGNAPVTISSSGVLTFTVKASGADSFRLTFDAEWAGVVRSVSVKGVAVISYNHLNLPSMVAFPSDKQLSYIYDAAGRKLCQKVEKSGVVLKKTDYSGEFFYENDTLKFINHEEGRVVMTGTAPEYQYHLKDHLGNVRVTFTSKDEVDSDKATLETENTGQEQAKFLNYAEAVTVNHEIFDRTSDGAINETYNATRLVGGTTNQVYGLARSLSVMPGDEISMEVYAKYLELDPDPANWTSTYRNFLEAYASGTPPAGSVIDGGLPGSVGNAIFPFPSFIMPGSKSETAPKAYLNWIVCDRNHQPIIGECGFVQIGSTGVPLPRENGTNVAHELLTRATPLKINQSGYVYIYLSNENETSVEVFFDDFKVEHKKSQVVQMDDYYPFGLTFNSYSRESSVKNKYLYNAGSELQDGLDLGVYETFYRMLDPASGRWWQVDPMVDELYFWTPYNYSFNNPIRYNDPKGDCPPGVDCGALASALGSHISENPDGAVAAVSGFVLGLGNAAGNSISGVINAVTHPIETLNGLASLSTVEGQVTAGVSMAVAGAQKVDQFQNGSALDKGIVVGEVTGAVVEAVVGTKGAGAMLKTAEAGTALKTLNKLDNLGNPFKNSTLKQVANSMEKRVENGAMRRAGPDPANGRGGYVNNKSGYSYHLDKGGKYGKGGKVIEKPHVDVNYPNPKPANVSKKKLDVKDN